MVRTKAHNSAARKTVAAKAPRKNLASSPRVVSPSSSTGKPRKLRQGGGGSNPVKIWPTPSWQKGIDMFISGDVSSSSSSSSSVACSSSSPNHVDKESLLEKQTTSEEDMEGEEEEVQFGEEEKDEDDVNISSNGSRSHPNESPLNLSSSRLALLGSDLVQLGSDDED